MQIFIDNKPAAIKTGTSFEYVSENPLFTGSEGYTLAITLPLRDCAQNQAIFGHINRADITAGSVLFDGCIIDRNLTKYGSFAITEISELEVKVQFLEGRSAANYDATFDNIYINELDLGTGPAWTIDQKIFPVLQWDSVFTEDDGKTPLCACLPYLYKEGSKWNEQEGNMGIFGQYQIPGTVSEVNYRWGWHVYMKKFSYQPYLLHIVKEICRQLGYEADLSQWQKYDSLKYLLICNTLPPSYELPNFARALPHWTVDEFFHQLELLLGGDFAIDHKARTIKFNYWRNIIDTAGTIQIDKIVDEHTVSVSIDDADCDYLGSKAIEYKDNGSTLWNLHCCPDFIDIYKSYFTNSRKEGIDAGDRMPIIEYGSLDALTRAMKTTINGNTVEFYRLMGNTNLHNNTTYEDTRLPLVDALLYVQDVDQYFILYEYRRNTASTGAMVYQYMDLMPLNIFGPRILDKENVTDTEELSIVPARVGRWDTGILSANQRNILYLAPKSKDADTEKQIKGRTINDLNKKQGKPWPQQALDQQTDKIDYPEYYDKIYLGWYKKSQWDSRMDKIYEMDNREWPKEYMPYPKVSEYRFSESLQSCEKQGFSLRLNSDAYLERTGLRKIDPRIKATFKFLSDTIPSPRAIFNIRGKQYLCAKISATFTETGMSQLLSGEFYPLIS